MHKMREKLLLNDFYFFVRLFLHWLEKCGQKYSLYLKISRWAASNILYWRVLRTRKSNRQVELSFSPNEATFVSNPKIEVWSAEISFGSFLQPKQTLNNWKEFFLIFSHVLSLKREQCRWEPAARWLYFWYVLSAKKGSNYYIRTDCDHIK